MGSKWPRCGRRPPSIRHQSKDLLNKDIGVMICTANKFMKQINLNLKNYDVFLQIYYKFPSEEYGGGAGSQGGGWAG